MSVLTRHKIGWPIISMVGGVFIGLILVAIYKSFQNTYATFIAAAIIGPFLLFIVGNTKWVLWGLLTACLPITIDITLGHTGHLSGAAGYVISVFDIILIILYLIWFFEMVRSKSFNIRFFPRVSIPTIIIFAISMVSMAYAQFPELSKYEIIEIVKIYLAFLYVANNIKNERDLQIIIFLLIAGLLFEGLLGFAQHRYSEPFWPSSLGGPKWIDNRISGTWVSSNDFSWYLTFILPIALSFMFSQIPIVFKCIYGASLVIGAGSLIWTNSRGGWISFIMGAIYVLIFVFGKIRGRWNLAKTVISIMAIMIIISPIYPRLTAKLYGRFSGEDRGSAESRLPQFEVAYNIIIDKPFTGVGLNNYTEIMGKYDTTREGLETITPHAVHNIFLLIAAEIGVFGITAFIFIVVLIFDAGIRRSTENDKFVPYAVIGLLGGIIAFLFHGLVDTASLGNKLFLFFWFYGGIIVSSANIAPTMDPNNP